MIRAIIVGHGRFGEAMMSGVEQILGKQERVDIISNTGISCAVLNKKIEEIIEKDRETDYLIFLDLPGGSCTISCYTVMKKCKKLNAISGVNLPMLIEFFILRNKYSVKKIISLLIKKGKKNIIQLKCDQ